MQRDAAMEVGVRDDLLRTAILVSVPNLSGNFLLSVFRKTRFKQSAEYSSGCEFLKLSSLCGVNVCYDAPLHPRSVRP